MVPTVEQTLAAMEKGGWHLASLSYVAHRGVWSAMLERTRKNVPDSRTVFAFNSKDCEPTAAEAMAAAWANAQEMNARVIVQGGNGERPVKEPSLADFMAEHAGLTMLLEDALRAHINCLRGVEDDGDDFL